MSDGHFASVARSSVGFRGRSPANLRRGCESAHVISSVVKFRSSYIPGGSTVLKINDKCQERLSTKSTKRSVKTMYLKVKNARNAIIKNKIFYCRYFFQTRSITRGKKKLVYLCLTFRERSAACMHITIKASNHSQVSDHYTCIRNYFKHAIEFSSRGGEKQN